MKTIVEDIRVNVGPTKIKFEFDLSSTSMNSYAFGQMKKFYDKLKDVLDRNNLQFEWFAEGKRIANTFIAGIGPLEDASFVWYKYEGFKPGGGQNHVMNKTSKIKMSEFMTMTDDEQDSFVLNSPKDANTFKIGDIVKTTDDDGIAVIGKITAVSPNKSWRGYSISAITPKGNGKPFDVDSFVATVEMATPEEVTRAKTFGNRFLDLPNYKSLIKSKTVNVGSSHLTSMEGCPQNLSSLSSINNYLTTFEFLPTHCYSLMLNNNSIVSLKNVHHYLKEVKNLYLRGNPIKDGWLNLFFIKGLKYVESDMDFEANQIFQKYLPMGKAGLVPCQVELLQKGFDEYASL